MSETREETNDAIIKRWKVDIERDLYDAIRQRERIDATIARLKGYLRTLNDLHPTEGQ